MSDLQFWLSFNNGAERLRLPVNPPELKIDSGYSWETVQIANLGEYSIPSGHPLTLTSISSFFPKVYNSSYCGYKEIPDPEEAVKLIDKWKESRRPIRFVVTGTFINYAMTIEKFSFYEKAGALGDKYFDLELREYRFISIKRIDLTPKPAAPGKVASVTKTVTQRPNTKAIPKTYTVKSGDYLSKIASRLKTSYGYKKTWLDIYNANKAKIGKNPNVIKPGMVLTIP